MRVVLPQCACPTTATLRISLPWYVFMGFSFDFERFDEWCTHLSCPPTLALEFQEADPSTSLRFAQDDSKDGARGIGYSYFGAASERVCVGSADPGRWKRRGARIARRR